MKILLHYGTIAILKASLLFSVHHNIGDDDDDDDYDFMQNHLPNLVKSNTISGYENEHNSNIYDHPIINRTCMKGL